MGETAINIKGEREVGLISWLMHRVLHKKKDWKCILEHHNGKTLLNNEIEHTLM